MIHLLFRLTSSLFILFFFFGCGPKVVYYGGGNSSYSEKSYEYDDSQIRSQYDTSSIRSGANIHRATMRPYTINGKTYYPNMVEVGNTFSGIASWYGPKFHGKKTSNGETYNMYDMTAAHKTLPMNTVLKVTNLKNKKEAIVRINDRGPFVKTRIIDLSYAVAKRLDVVKNGTAPVMLEVLGFDGKITTLTQNNSYEQTHQKTDYLLQIGAFHNSAGAQSFRQKHNQNGYAYRAIIKQGFYNDKEIYRVYLQGFRSEEEIKDFKQSFGFEDALIIGE